MFDESPQFSPLGEWLRVVGKLLILAGMMIFFASMMSLLSMWVCQQGLQVNLQEAISATLKPEQSTEILALKVFQVLAGSIGMFLIPALLFPKALQTQFSSFVPHKTKVFWPFWIIGLGLIIVSSPFSNWLGTLNHQISFPSFLADWEISLKAMEESAGKLTELMTASHSISQLMLNLFVVALVPAICEELFFRGVLQNYLRIATNNGMLAIIVTSVIFSALHGQFYGFLPRVLMGMILGLVYYNTANILVPIAMHLLNNGLAVFLIYLYRDQPDAAILSDTYSFAWYWVVLSIGATIAGLYFLRPLITYYIKNRFNH